MLNAIAANNQHCLGTGSGPASSGISHALVGQVPASHAQHLPQRQPLATVINMQEPGSGGRQLLPLHSSCLECGGPGSLMGSPGSSPGLPQCTWRLFVRPWAMCCQRQPGFRGCSQPAEVKRLCLVVHSLVSSGFSSCCLSLRKSLRSLHKLKSASTSSTTAVAAPQGWGDLFMSESESLSHSVESHSFATHGL